MRRFLACMVLVCVGSASARSVAQVVPDPDLAQAWPAWFVGDHAKARRHFQAAADRGHPLAQYNLAMMLLHGEGGPRRPAQGRRLLCKAADNGIELAAREVRQRRLVDCPSTNRLPGVPFANPDYDHNRQVTRGAGGLAVG